MLFSKYIKLVLPLVLVSLASCSKKPQSVPLEPLTDEQISSLQSFSNSFSNIEKVNSDVKGDSLVALDAGSQSISDSISTNCVSVLPTPPTGSNFSLESSISGANCPVAYSLKMSITVTQASSSASMAMTLDTDYKLLDETLHQHADITAMNFSGQLNASGNDQSFSGGGSFAGGITSQEHGQVGLSLTISMSGSQSSYTTTSTIRYIFSSFTAEGVITTSGENVSYKINGVDATEEEFNNIFGKSITGMTST